MARSVERKGGQTRPDDDYFAKQWAELQESEKAREEELRHLWLRMQKSAEKRAPYTPWLLIPAALTDFGQRPLVSGQPYWASPYIGVFSPDPSGKPLAGAPNTVWARVFNLGASTSAPTMLRYYWADPSVGLGAADAHLIGEVMVEVKPLSSAVVPCPKPWVPTYLNGGHECLFVTAENPVFDPIQAPFKPWLDRHVGQRNMQVVPAVAQAMNLWLPGGFGPGPAALRVLALRVRMPDLPRQANAVATLAQVADHVLAGFGSLSRKTQAEHRLRFDAERIAPDKVIAEVKLTGETRPADEAAAPAGPEIKTPDRWGEPLLRFEKLPGVNQQLAVAFRDLDLGGDDFVLLQFTWVGGGHLLGGYVVTLAHPGWFKAARERAPARGDQMALSQRDMDLRDIVIRNNPQAAATYEIASQLERLLPIESPKQISVGIKLGDTLLRGEMFAQLGEAMFPIRDAEELVVRCAAILRMFVTYGNANRGSLEPETMRLLDRLEGHGERHDKPVLVAQGKPIFPLPPEKKKEA